MMSQERLEAEVRNGLLDGKNAAQISKQTGVPLARVQAIVHQVNGRDPAQARKDSLKKRRQGDRQLFGSTLSAPRQLGPNSRRGSRSR